MAMNGNVRILLEKSVVQKASIFINRILFLTFWFPEGLKSTSS